MPSSSSASGLAWITCCGARKFGYEHELAFAEREHGVDRFFAREATPERVIYVAAHEMQLAALRTGTNLERSDLSDHATRPGRFPVNPIS